MKARLLAVVGIALLIAVAAFATAPTSPARAAKKGASRPNCKQLLPIGKVEETIGGEVTLEHFGHSDFILNALTPGTERGTECVYGTTEATVNDYFIAGTVNTAFQETPKQWNGYRASVKNYSGLEATTFAPVKLGGGTQAFVLHQELGGGEPDLFYLYVFTKEHNMFSLDLFNGVTLKTEESLGRELARSLDAAWRAAK
jgi:hypothetical protein